MGLLRTVFRRKMCKGTVVVLLSQILLLVVLDRLFWAVDREQEPRRLGTPRHGRFRPRRLREGAEHVHEDTVTPGEGKPAGRQEQLVKLSRQSDNAILDEFPDFSDDSERKAWIVVGAARALSRPPHIGFPDLWIVSPIGRLATTLSVCVKLITHVIVITLCRTLRQQANLKTSAIDQELYYSYRRKPVP
ncbi:hypothetical protein Bbelb_360020 [Branchiostoma belcheri]|nr:hypothetical protein Bbelb_360020 [Branchiostoma belcheri]